jgi:hypothetical protein
MTSGLEYFLLGVIASLSLVAGFCFLKFWRKTRDPLFFAFALSFLIRSMNDASRGAMTHPNAGSLWSYVVGIASSLLILIAIVRKNVGGKDA